jgi:hypothetical protein
VEKRGDLTLADVVGAGNVIGEGAIADCGLRIAIGSDRRVVLSAIRNPKSAIVAPFHRLSRRNNIR